MKTAVRKEDAGKCTGRLFFVLIIVCSMLAVLSTAATAENGGTIKDSGTLTKIDYEIVTIDEKKYTISTSADIIGWENTHSPLDSFSVPCRVYFEYEETGTGRVISRIQEIVG
jgi:hypothetical protein